MRVLVTRPVGDGEETARRLRAKGHEAMLAPLLEILLRNGPPLTLDHVQAVLITSANGASALAARTRRRDLPILAVGRESARRARDAGFTDVRDADGDATALANLVANELTPSSGTLFHAAGAETRGDLAKTLAARGFTIRSEILYEAVGADALPADSNTALASGNIDAVLLFSPRTARIFREIVENAGLTQQCRGMVAICISEATAQALRPLAFRAVRVASHPDQDAMLAMVDDVPR